VYPKFFSYEDYYNRMVLADTMVGAFNPHGPQDEPEEVKKERIAKAKPLEPKQILEMAKQSLDDAKIALGQFFDESPDFQSTSYLHTDYFKLLQKCVVMNSLAITKAISFNFNCRATADWEFTDVCPVIDVVANAK